MNDKSSKKKSESNLVKFFGEEAASHFEGLERLASSIDGGRKLLKKGGTSLNKYSDPEYIEACRNDAKRNLVIWSR